MKRQPPRSRHTEPFWTAPRRAASRRRVPPTSGRVERCFAMLKAMRTSVIAMAEGPGIRPLTRAQRTQVIWPPASAGVIPVLKVRPPGFDRLLKLLFIKEGSPCCN